jgi:hypothetical protein
MTSLCRATKALQAFKVLRSVSVLRLADDFIWIDAGKAGKCRDDDHSDDPDLLGRVIGDGGPDVAVLLSRAARPDRRRAAPCQPRPLLTAGPIRIDLPDRSVSVDERRVELSAVEYRLFCQLVGEPTRVLTKVNLEPP